MIYTKPNWRASHTEMSNFLDSLPDSFEIVPEGSRLVEWPSELTRERLDSLASAIDTSQPNAWECWPGQANALRALAAIAPVEKKKRKVEIWEDANGELHVRAPKHALPAWTKKGECEVDA